MAEHRIALTRHAASMLVERSIEHEWVERTITTPDFVESDPQREGVFRAYRSIKEREGRMLRVVYMRDDDAVRIITAFFDRARR